MNTRKNSSDFPVRRWYGDAFGISGAVFLLTLLLVIFNVKVFVNFEDNITATFNLCLVYQKWIIVVDY